MHHNLIFLRDFQIFKGNLENSPLAQFTVHTDITVMRINDSLGNGKSQSIAPHGAGAGLMNPEETLKELIQVLNGYTNTIIPYRKMNTA